MKPGPGGRSLGDFELFESPSRRGYGPVGRALWPVDTLTFASMRLLVRDDELRGDLESLALARPACPSMAPGVPTRFIVAHATAARAGHTSCRLWLVELVGIARRLGCPSLHAVLHQLALSTDGLPPGAVASTRLRRRRRPTDGRAGPRRPIGTLDRPARDLLARRAHGVGGIAALRSMADGMRWRLGLPPRPADPPLRAVLRGGWAGVELEFDQLIAAWERGVEPAPLDLTYPAWREWKRNPERAAGRGRDRVRLEDSRRLEAADLGQIYRKAAARIERLLDADLPSFD